MQNIGALCSRRRVISVKAPKQFGMLFSFMLLVSVPVHAAEPETSDGGADALIKSLVLATLPREYENTKRWGSTKRQWDGLHVSFDGLRLDTKRRWKNVNHGTWTRYKAILVDPDRQLGIQTNHLRQVANQRVAFDLNIDAKLDLVGRLSEWRHGVQLYSFSAEADATVRLSITCEVGLKFDSTRFPPDVYLAPSATAAKLELHEFHLHAISDLHGPLVREFGEELHDILQDEISERQGKLVEKINRSLDKHSGKLRISLHDLTTGSWSAVVPAMP